MHVQEVLETCLYAEDLDAAEKFYRDVLGLEPFAREIGRHVFFRCGNRMVLVFNPTKTNEAGSDIPRHGCRGAGHAAFAVRENELSSWRSQLSAKGVTIEREIDWPQGGHSIYFRDPAGNSVELATPKLWALEESAVFGR